MMKLICVLVILSLSTSFAAERLPITSDYWKSDSFLRSFLGSYLPENRIEPFVSEEERELLQSMQVEMQNGNRDGAIAVLRASSRTKNSAVLSFNLGNLLFEEGELEAAVEAYRQAADRYPDFRRAHTALGAAFARLEQFQEAVGHLSKAVSLGDQSGNTYGLLGYCWLTQEKHHAALQAYRLAQMTMPEVLDWKLGEAQCLQQLGDHAAAAGLFADAVKLEADNADLWLHYAGALMASGRFTEAASALDLVRRLGGESWDADAARTSGDLYLRMDLVDLAVDRYAYAMTSETPVPLPTALSVVDQVSRQFLWEATETLSRVIGENYEIVEETPESRKFRRLQALVSMETGKADEAAAMLEEILEEDPMDGEALLLLARYRAGEDAFEEAEMLLERAKRVSSVEARAYLEHGQLLVARKDWAAALKELKRAHELEPSERLANYIEEVGAAAASTGAGRY